jgi:capsid protein
VSWFGRVGSWLGGYDAASYRGGNRRRQNAIDLRHEDRVLKPRDRDKLISEARILRRNASDVAWAVRKHLDYVSTFTFQCRIPNPKNDPTIDALNKTITDLFAWWSRPLNCDAAGRHSFWELLRLWESGRTSDGDIFVVKLSDGTVQSIEGDRVRTPSDLGDYRGTFKFDDFYHGVVTDDYGASKGYAICDRGKTSLNNFVLAQVVKANNLFHHGYFDRVDQVRGISPLASAINTFCDLYEAREYALAKMKLSQLFALKFNRAADVEADLDDTTESSDNGYSFDFGAGPQVIDLDKDDQATFMESQTPSSEFQSFMLQGMQAGLKSLDIPFSFYDESHTNYSGSRQAWIQYDQSAQIKRGQNRGLATSIWVWRLGLFIADGQLVLPKGMTIGDIKFEFVATGLPWIDPLKEVTADAFAINAKLKSRQMICRERGDDWFDVVDQLSEEQKYLEGKGMAAEIPTNVTVNISDSGGDNGGQKAA